MSEGVTPEVEIRRTLALFARRFDDHDEDGWSELFTEDGTFVSPGRGPQVGRPAIKRFIQGYIAREPADRQTRHLCLNDVIRRDGSSAEATIDFIVYERFGPGSWQVSGAGRYAARLVDTNGRWLFSHHQQVIASEAAASH